METFQAFRTLDVPTLSISFSGMQTTMDIKTRENNLKCLRVQRENISSPENSSITSGAHAEM